MIPGEIRAAEEPIALNEGRERDSLLMVNEGDRPIQIGSHLHLPGANPALVFDREKAKGFRLDVPSGTSVRFEPGVSRMVDIVALGGRKFVPGLQLRDPSELPTHDREPKKVVPFGTPGTEVEKPPRAGGKRVRMSEEPAQSTEQPTEQQDQEEDA